MLELLSHSNKLRRRKQAKRRRDAVLLGILLVAILVLSLVFTFASVHSLPEQTIINELDRERQHSRDDLKQKLRQHRAKNKKYSVKMNHDHEEKHNVTYDHTHAIPNNVFFTHYINLLTSSTLSGEDMALQKNVQNTISLHTQANVFFWTDDQCLDSIRRVMGEDSPLLGYFLKETQGMFKADICRGAALYEHGGLYFDVDLQARMNMWEVVSPRTTFVVPLVHKDSKHPGNFFQAFIGVTRNNPIMKRYLELFIRYYEGFIDIQGPLGVILLRRAHDEVLGKNKFGHHAQEQGVQKTEYWQEVLYHPKLFPKIPPPTWGKRRACHFVVVANRKKPFVVPFYSRVKGSRMCGGADSEKKG